MPRPSPKSRMSAEQEIRNRMKAAEMQFRGARAQIDSMNQQHILRQHQDLRTQSGGGMTPPVRKPRPRRKPSNRNLA